MAGEVGKVIHANVFDPAGFRLFKAKANDKAECQTITCTNLECPLLARGQCYMRGGLSGNSCPYGKSRRESGPTKRSGKCSSWVREKRELHKGVPYLEVAPERMEFVGDYVLLPYAHMTLCKEVPFKSRSSLFLSGDAFLPKEHWTLATVLALLRCRPQALMGGEIICYQREVIPKFLLHLREVDPEMWERLIEVRPDLNVQADHVGRKAVLATLKSPIEWVESSERGEYPVHWKWDGETLTTKSKHVYNSTWGRMDVDSVVMEAIPAKRAVIVVRSNDWVCKTTEFVS